MTAPFVTLSRALGLRPLDRLQINTAYERRELRALRGLEKRNDLPFHFFQRLLADGRLEVCSPGGFLSIVEPGDVCDILHGEPIIVRAMPHDVFTRRLAIPLAQQQAQPSPECYAPAYVMRVEKDRWNRIDRVFVQFLDESLKATAQGVASIHDT